MKSLILLSAFFVSNFNSYSQIKEVMYGNQVWMSANLNVSNFRNGDPIPEVRSDSAWAMAGLNGKPAWCYYDNDPVNGRRYGKLYNWHAVTDKRGLAPVGWHMPSALEWADLCLELGGEKKAGEVLRSKAWWDEDDESESDEEGFNALPAGMRNPYGNFKALSERAYIWSKTEDDTYTAWARNLNSFDGSLGRYKGIKLIGMSVRCIKD